MAERRRRRRRKRDRAVALLIAGIVVLVAAVGIWRFVSKAYPGNTGTVELPPLDRPFIKPQPTPAPAAVPAPTRP